MVDLGFYECLGAGDGDAVLADELGRRDVVGTEGFCDQRHGAGSSRIGRFDRDLCESWFVIKRDGLRTAQVNVSFAAQVYLPVVVDGDMMPVKPALLCQPVELDPISA